MPTTVQIPAGEPEEPDRPSPSIPEPYWRRQAWLPAGYRDTEGMLADLLRRLLSAVFGLSWRLSLDVSVRAFVHAADEQAACLAMADALRHPATIIALSRAEPDAVPPWRPLGPADRVELYTEVHAHATDHGVWKCHALLLARFTVDAADASWPTGDYAIDVVPARTQPRLQATEAKGPIIIARRPTRPRRHR